MQGDVLSCQPDIAACNLAVLDQFAGHVLGCIDADGEAQTLRSGNRGGIDSDHSAGGIDQRPPGVAGVERSVGLDDLIDHASGFGAHAASQRAYYSCCNCELEAIRISQRNRQLPHA